MVKNLASGIPASEIFYALKQEDPSMDALKFGELITEEFPNISPAIMVCLDRWLAPNSPYEYPEGQIDAMILHYLEKSGYVRDSSSM